MPKPPIFWDRMEGSTTKEVINNIAPTTHGTVDYTTGYFGNGVRCDSNGEGIDYNGWASNFNSFIDSAFTIEFYVQTTYNVINGTHDIGDGSVRYFFWASVNTSNFIQLQISAAHMGFFGRYNGTNRFLVSTDASLDWSAGDWVHLACVADASGIDGGANTMQLYFNGSQVGSLSTGLGTTSGTYAEWIIGTVTGYAANSHVNGIIDNLKIYDYAKTDFSDRYRERGGMNDGIVII